MLTLKMPCGMRLVMLTCRKIEESREAEIEAAQEAEKIKRTIRALELAGYTVTKEKV